MSSAQKSSERRAESGDARYWLIAVLALSVIGWLWIQKPVTPVSPESLGSPVRMPAGGITEAPPDPRTPVDSPKATVVEMPIPPLVKTAEPPGPLSCWCSVV